MIASALISDTITSVTSTESAGMALDWMNEFKINQMPIVDQGKYIGIVTEDDILDSADLEVPIGEIRFSGWDSAYIYQGNHVYDAIEVMSNLKLELLPVLDEENDKNHPPSDRRHLIKRHIGCLCLRCLINNWLN